VERKKLGTRRAKDLKRKEAREDGVNVQPVEERVTRHITRRKKRRDQGIGGAGGLGVREKKREEGWEKIKEQAKNLFSNLKKKKARPGEVVSRTKKTAIFPARE